MSTFLSLLKKARTTNERQNLHKNLTKIESDVNGFTNLPNRRLLQGLIRASLDTTLKERNFTLSYVLYLIFLLVISAHLSLGLPNGVFLQLQIKIMCAFLNMCRLYISFHPPRLLEWLLYTVL
jgi:hypothetical protein